MDQSHSSLSQLIYHLEGLRIRMNLVFPEATGVSRNATEWSYLNSRIRWRI